jgi:hypothetical protein
MLKTIAAGMTALAVITGPSLGYAQSPSRASERLNAADLSALTDARIAVVKSTLQLTADQEKYWPPIEEAIRARAKNRQSRVENLTTGVADRADRGVIEVLRDRNPVEFLDRRADVLAQRSADLKKLSAAWQPLYQTLTPVQKRNLGYLTISVLRELRDRAEDRRMESERRGRVRASGSWWGPEQVLTSSRD